MASRPVPGRRVAALLVFTAAVLLLAPISGWRDRASLSPDHRESGPACAGTPLPSLVAVDLSTLASSGIPDYVRTLVERYARSGVRPLNGHFPLGNTRTDTLRTIPGFRSNVVVSWLDSLTGFPDGPRFGANNDFIAWFGDGWNADSHPDVVGPAPRFNGSADAGWAWVNHEYVSNDAPQPGAAPNGQHLTLARHLRGRGLPDFDVDDGSLWDQPAVDAYIEAWRGEVGGSWIRLARSPGSGRWTLVRHPDARRFDATDSTLLTLTGYRPVEPDHLDDGDPMPAAGVVTGITNDCSGTVSPWGTVISAEENVHASWGDFETGWNANQFDPLDPVWGAGRVIDPAGAGITRASASSGFGSTSVTTRRHNRDLYGFLVEIEPALPPDRFYRSHRSGHDGSGHRKIGAVGRGPWENAAFVTGPDLHLIDGRPIVIYGGHDRRNGRIYKFVSTRSWSEGMSRAETRSLLDDGTLYVAHFEDLDVRTGLTRHDPANPSCDDTVAWSDVETLLDWCTRFTEAAPGTGKWIRLSVDNDTDVAPNAAALGPGTTVGAALRDNHWNGIGGFAEDNTILGALFTASAKIGISEMNRPEDVEWDPVNRRIFVAMTRHGRKVGLKQDGTLARASNGTAVETERRVDDLGSIWTLVETLPDDPATSTGFAFWPVWTGGRGTGPFDAANPDNLLIDRDGGLWFATDGNPGTSGTADALYYLDLDPSRGKNAPGIVFPTRGKAFRIVAGPSDSEVTGPEFNSDMRTLFLSIQHPGEHTESRWPAHVHPSCLSPGMPNRPEGIE